MKKPDITEVLEKHRNGLMDIPGVNGTGIGMKDGEACIKVFVEGLNEEIQKKIPESVEGYRVAIEVIGRIGSR